MKKRRLKRQASQARQASKQEESKLQGVDDLVKELDEDLEDLYLMSVELDKQWGDLIDSLEDYQEFLLSIDI